MDMVIKRFTWSFATVTWVSFPSWTGPYSFATLPFLSRVLVVVSTSAKKKGKKPIRINQQRHRIARDAYLFVLLLLFLLGGRELLRVRQVVDSDGQEHVQQRVVAEQHEDDEVQSVYHPSALGLCLTPDALVHDFVPIFAGQDLYGIHTPRSNDGSDGRVVTMLR